MNWTLPGRLWRNPQNVWARRALFQIHLWAGIGAGIYILLISVSGSVIVFRNELYKSFVRPPLVVEPSGTPLTDDELKAAAKRAYPSWTIANVWRVKNPNQVVEIWLERNKNRKQRAFNPYTGADLGNPDPAGLRFVLWLVDLHDNLLYQDIGRKVNGAGAILLTVLCITGAVIWWPGIVSWRRSLVANWTGNWKRFNWGLHSALGFWSFAFVFVWAVSGIYLVFPDPFTAVIDYLQPDEAQRGLRAGDEVLRWVARLHFGRFAGWPIKTLWFLIGFAPVILFITGVIMWWNRVIIPLLAEEGWRAAPGWSARRTGSAGLTTPAAPSVEASPYRARASGAAHPPLLCEEGNVSQLED